MNIAWTIAGNDSSGGAGITADLLSFHHLNVQGCSVITAATAQNAKGVEAVNLLSVEQIKSQISALKEIHAPTAIKIGMMGSTEIIDTLKECLTSIPAKIVLDPVMIASSGSSLCQAENKNYIQHLKKLLPLADLITPNLHEAAALIDADIHTQDDVIMAAEKILSFGAKTVVIKGGHFSRENLGQDYWTDGSSSFWLCGKPWPQKNYHGSGCVFSAAVAASLASAYSMQDALVLAKMLISRGMRLAKSHGENIAYLQHGGLSEDPDDLPIVTSSISDEIISFPSCKEIGLYPVVDSIDWIKKLLALGVKTIQLRIKEKADAALENEIRSAIQLARQFDAKLFINDHWQLAILHGAYGVHLGQEDLNTADIRKIHAAGLHLGISTHSPYEVARAHAWRPSYFAFGPIYHTNTKAMPFAPQGVDKLSWWRKVLKPHAVVAIGGINERNIADVVKTGVDGVAMISAITGADDYAAMVKYFIEVTQGGLPLRSP